ncbi:MAG TPA: NADH-quinone oxidoreductase subunit A, partial [Gemmatimonadales bacterium]|nr:NADH-quinone oxidoreductase subunit A [Gemmatimonadales bacterium]
MDASTIHEYRFVLAFLVLGLVFGMIAVAVPHFIAPRGRGQDTFKTYESGIVPERGAWRQFSLGYYLYALLYLAVAVDVIYLLPVALVFRTMHTWQVLVEIVVFVAILAVAVVYSWRTG